MNAIVERILKYWLYIGTINEEDKEIYRYGLEHMILQLLNGITVLVIGICFCSFIETLIFSLAFVMLRKYTGGYHATTRLRCYVISTLSTILCIWLIKNFSVWHNAYWVIYLCVGLVICMYSPVGTKNKPLDVIENMIYGTRARLVWGIETLVFIIAYLLGMHAWAFAVFVAHLLVIVSLAVGHVQMRIWTRGILAIKR